MGTIAGWPASQSTTRLWGTRTFWTGQTLEPPAQWRYPPPVAWIRLQRLSGKGHRLIQMLEPVHKLQALKETGFSPSIESK